MREVFSSPEAKAQDVNALQRLLRDLGALQQADLPQELSDTRWTHRMLRGLKVDSCTITQHEELVARLQQWQGCGWVEATGAVHEVGEGHVLGAVVGRVLSADLARSDVALRVRPAGTGWTFTELRETSDPLAPEAVPVLVHGVRHVSVRGSQERLCYRVASRLHEGTLRLLDAWFVGFEPGQSV